MARSRRGRTTWSNGGTEVELARESAVDPTSTTSRVEAVAVLEAHGLGASGRRASRLATRTLVTCAMPLDLRWLVEAGLGTERALDPAVRDGVVVARIERVYARRVLDAREEVPRGPLAREAVAELILSGRVLAEPRARAAERLEAWALLARLLVRRRPELPPAVALESPDPAAAVGDPVPPFEPWLGARLESLAFETGEDLALLTPEDLAVPDLPPATRAWLDRVFPRAVAVADVTYRTAYDLDRDEVTLEADASRARRPPPQLSYLPTFPGLRIVVRDRGVTKVIRE